MWLKQGENWVNLFGLRRLRLKSESKRWYVVGVDDNMAEHRIGFFESKGEAVMLMDELGEKLNEEEKRALTKDDLEDIKVLVRDVLGNIGGVKEGRKLERKPKK